MPADPAPSYRNWALMAQAGSALTGPALVGIVLDVSFNWSPWGTLGGILLGLIACVAHLIRLSNRSFDGNQSDQSPK